MRKLEFLSIKASEVLDLTDNKCHQRLKRFHPPPPNTVRMQLLMKHVRLALITGVFLSMGDSSIIAHQSLSLIKRTKQKNSPRRPTLREIQTEKARDKNCNFQALEVKELARMDRC